MTYIKFAAALAVIAPAIALAQVGPNPAVNGSLDPTVGPTGDRATAPNDTPPTDDAPAMSTPMTNAMDTTAPSSDPVTNTATDAKRTTAPTSESMHKKPR